MLSLLGSIALVACIHLAFLPSQGDEFSQKTFFPVSLDEDSNDVGDSAADGADDEAGAQNAYTDDDSDTSSADGDGGEGSEAAAPPPCSGPTCYMQGIALHCELVH